MKTKRMALTVCMALVFATAARGQDAFIPGNIFVAGVIGEGCSFDGNSIIVELDPIIGPVNLLATSQNGLCDVSGLRFTPAGDRLLTLNFGRFLPPIDPGFVLSIGPDEIGTVVFDGSDGISRPFGANGLAFDAAGDLYVVNTGNNTILRIPAEGGPGTVFADFNDGIFDRGALDFAPNGDLFYCSDLTDAIIRITPAGESSLFDTLPAPSSLAFDSAGNLFVGAGQAGVGVTFYRYDNGDASSLRILASGFLGESGVPLALTLSPDGSELYFFEIGGVVYGIDAEDGTRRVIGDLTEFFYFAAPTGITVYAPPPQPPVPAVSTWGLVLMGLILITAATIVLIRKQVVRVHVQFNES